MMLECGSLLPLFFRHPPAAVSCPYMGNEKREVDRSPRSGRVLVG